MAAVTWTGEEREPTMVVSGWDGNTPIYRRKKAHDLVVCCGSTGWEGACLLRRILGCILPPSHSARRPTAEVVKTTDSRRTKTKQRIVAEGGREGGRWSGCGVDDGFYTEWAGHRNVA